MIERHVVSFDLAKKLKAAGFPQDCYFAWWRMADGSLEVWNPTDHSDYETGRETRMCAAPMLSEVMEQMPAGTEARAWMMLDNVLVWRALARFDKPDAVEEMMNYGHTGPDAAALLWLAIKEWK